MVIDVHGRRAYDQFAIGCQHRSIAWRISFQRNQPRFDTGCGKPCFNSRKTTRRLDTDKPDRRPLAGQLDSDIGCDAAKPLGKLGGVGAARLGRGCQPQLPVDMASPTDDDIRPVRHLRTRPHARVCARSATG